MSKLKKVLHGLKLAQDALDELDNAGIDTDRLIGISNAQGPQGRVLKGLLSAVSGLVSSDEAQPSSKQTRKPRVVKKAASKQLKA